MSWHFKRACSCGTVIDQCRCPSPDKRVEVVERGCVRCLAEPVKCAPPASTPAPAWVWHSDDCADLYIGPFAVEVTSRCGTWRGAVEVGGAICRRVGPYPTAPEAARAAVAALRAIVEPVVEGLKRVPELEQP